MADESLPFYDETCRVTRSQAIKLLAENWPDRGRHKCELALAGALAQTGWNVDDAASFVLAAYQAVPDHDRSKYGRVGTAVRSTFAKHVKGKRITGWPVLASCIGKDAADRLRELVRRPS